MRIFTRVSVAVTASLSLASAAAAQTNGTINARAVVRQPITIAAGQDLDFGIVLQGTPATIASTAAAAGRFDATGTVNAPVNINFTLPANLVNGANNLPIGTWTGCYNQAAAVNTSGCTGIANMAGTTATSFGNVTGTGRLWVFVGATVSPAAGQAVGTYTNTVTMTLTYF
ncbi:MAG: hypothetical protein R2882_06670 [Gemmatimonadales bacterium]